MGIKVSNVGNLFLDSLPASLRIAIEGLLEALPERYLNTIIDNAALGGALLAGLASLVRLIH